MTGPIVLGVTALVLSSFSPLSAQTALTVNSVDDVDDGMCDATHCSLREAINAANANTGADIIEFDISGAGPHTIQPASTLPTITDPVVIDGYTQSGASSNTSGPDLGSNAVLMIELDGSAAGSGAFGLIVEAGNSTIRGLVVNRFHDVAILVQGPGGNVIEGCFLGTDATGTIGLANHSGVLINGVPDNTIGGTVPTARNVISANTFYGVSIINSGSTGNLVQGNFIGTDVTGARALGNGVKGVEIFDAPGNTVGGTAPAARNIISGNSGLGVEIQGSDAFGDQATANLVQGNFIGTDIGGVSDVGNGGFGVLISGASGNIVGGTTPGAANVIAFNGRDGVSFIRAGAETAVSSNSIFSNGELGIDLDDDGLTPNDVGDADTGANNLQNFPSLEPAFRGSSTLIEGTLNSATSTNFRIEFFTNSECDPSGNGEGGTFLDATAATTDANGNASFMLTLTSTVSDPYITATATDPNNNTSEFSECAAVVTDFTVAVSPAEATVDAGQSASYTVAVSPIGASLDDPVTLACSDLPSLTSCSFSPASMTPGAGDATSTLTVSTTGPSSSSILGPRSNLPRLWYALGLASYIAGGLLGIVLFGAARTFGGLAWRKLAVRVAPVLVASMLLYTACGGEEQEIAGPGPGPGPRTPAGTYHFTITGTTASLERSVAATLVVR